MMQTLNDWWRMLSPRERVLVGGAAVLAGAVLLWFAILRPATAALDAQRAATKVAIERQGRVQAKLALLQTPRSNAAQPVLPPGALDQWVAQTAIERGFVLDRNEARGADQITLSMASARAPAVLAWLAELEAQGLLTDTLTLTPASSGTVAVVAELRRIR